MPGEMSSPTVEGVPELPLVMQTLRVELLGTPDGLQFPPLFQLLVLTAQLDGELSAHWPSAAGVEKHSTASRTTSAPVQRMAVTRSFFSADRTNVGNTAGLLGWHIALAASALGGFQNPSGGGSSRTMAL